MTVHRLAVGEIQQLAQTLTRSGSLLCFAGTPVAKGAPGGIQEILRLRQQTTVSATIGLTPISSAAAFTAPKLDTQTSHERSGHHVHHYAKLLPTMSADVVHDSFYPGPGLHQKGAERGRPSTEFWEISNELSEQIRQGEQEHLDDARRAYEVTYQCIEKQINRLAGQRFGPARTPAEAVDMALAELQKHLPPQLGTDPAKWVAALDRLLLMTKKRDQNLWHSIETAEIRQDGKRTIETLRASTFFQVGVTPSRLVVIL